MPAYYVRADGSLAAGSKSSATDPTSASTSLSLSAANACTFSAGDSVVFSSRGGAFSTGGLLIPSSGGAGSPITYRGEAGWRPEFTDATVDAHVDALSKSAIRIENMVSVGPMNSGFRLRGNCSNVICRDLEAVSSGNQGFQMEASSGASPTADWYNIVGRKCVDDGFSMHDASIARIYGGRFFRNDQGINYVSSAQLTCWDVASFGNTSHDLYLTAADSNLQKIIAHRSYFGGRVLLSSATGGWLNYAEFDRCRFAGVGPSSSAQHVVDVGDNSGTDTGFNSVFYACIFDHADATKSALVFRAPMGGTPSPQHVVEQCTFAQSVLAGKALTIIGSGVKMRNNLFVGWDTGIVVSGSVSVDSAGLAMYGNTTNTSGSGAPTPNLTSDPLLRARQNAIPVASLADWRPLPSSPLLAAGSSGLTYAKFDYYGAALGGVIGAVAGG